MTVITRTSLAESLNRTAWAGVLTPEQRARVERDIIERVFEAGSYVCRKGDPVDYWMGVSDGLLKMSSVSPQGKAVTFTGMLAGGWFGEGSLLKTGGRLYDVVALRDSHVVFMPRVTFNWLLDNSIAFNRFLLNQLNARLGLFISLVEVDRSLDADARVARCIASLFNADLNPAGGAELQISQEELGYLCSMSRQRANQALQVLERAGLLKLDYRGLTVLDLDGLRRF